MRADLGAKFPQFRLGVKVREWERGRSDLCRLMWEVPSARSVTVYWRFPTTCQALREKEKVSVLTELESSFRNRVPKTLSLHTASYLDPSYVPCLNQGLFSCKEQRSTRSSSHNGCGGISPRRSAGSTAGPCVTAKSSSSYFLFLASPSDVSASRFFACLLSADQLPLTAQLPLSSPFLLAVVLFKCLLLL